MKNPFYKLLASTLLMIIVLGCQKNEIVNNDGEPVTVSLAFKGDFDVDITQDPLTKVSTNDLYGINVFYDEDGDNISDDIYAYGLFDNVADMTITMLSNHTYKIVCTLIKDAKNKLYYGQAFENDFSGYAYPFQRSSTGSTLLNNKFIIGTGDKFIGLEKGEAHLITQTKPSTTNAKKNASLNRFYGVTQNYKPVPNGTITIELKRVIFGAKFVITGVKEGILNVRCGDFFSKAYATDNVGEEEIYTFTDIYTCWEKGTPLSAPIYLYYESNRPGTSWNMVKNSTINFNRNVMTTVNITLNPDLSGGIFNLTEEPLDEDNDIDIGINADGYIDIVVKPEN